jgi:hypothetical protein
LLGMPWRKKAKCGRATTCFAILTECIACSLGCEDGPRREAGQSYERHLCDNFARLRRPYGASRLSLASVHPLKRGANDRCASGAVISGTILVNEKYSCDCPATGRLASSSARSFRHPVPAPVEHGSGSAVARYLGRRISSWVHGPWLPRARKLSNSSIGDESPVSGALGVTEAGRPRLKL